MTMILLLFSGSIKRKTTFTDFHFSNFFFYLIVAFTLTSSHAQLSGSCFDSYVLDASRFSQTTLFIVESDSNLLHYHVC